MTAKRACFVGIPVERMLMLGWGLAAADRVRRGLALVGPRLVPEPDDDDADPALCLGVGNPGRLG